MSWLRGRSRSGCSWVSASQLADELAVAAQRKVGLDPFFQARPDRASVQAGDLRLGARTRSRKSANRCPAPQGRARGAKRGRRVRRPAPCSGCAPRLLAGGARTRRGRARPGARRSRYPGGWVSRRAHRARGASAAAVTPIPGRRVGAGPRPRPRDPRPGALGRRHHRRRAREQARRSSARWRWPAQLERPIGVGDLERPQHTELHRSLPGAWSDQHGPVLIVTAVPRRRKRTSRALGDVLKGPESHVSEPTACRKGAQHAVGMTATTNTEEEAMAISFQHRKQQPSGSSPKEPRASKDLPSSSRPPTCSSAATSGCAAPSRPLRRLHAVLSCVPRSVAPDAPPEGA